jgi:hypothetical protein
MKAKVFINQKAVNLVAALGMLGAMLTPAVFPMAVSADVLASRSIGMSASTADASGVTYDIKFTTANAWKSVIIDFCGDSPIPGQDCNVTNDLAGFSTSSASLSSNTLGIGTPTFTKPTATQLKLVGDGTAGTIGAVEAVVTGIHNPTAAGTFYARIYTFNGGTTPFNDYTDPNDPGTTIDTGGVALSATNDVSVSAAVRESMTFCVTGDSTGTPDTGTAYISDGCVTTGHDAPNLTLGHDTPAALDNTAVDTALVYSQISTNAAHGASVYMKNSNACGGLSTDGGTTCDIAAAGSTAVAIAAGEAKFGMRLGTTSVTGTGTITPVTTYSTSSDYGMGYSGTPSSGVASVYGDKIYDTTGAPIANGNVPMTFAASASATTPAGLYKANMSLVATGTF